jgi:NitT/TauT family transport system substrate-binding protein
MQAKESIGSEPMHAKRLSFVLFAALLWTAPGAAADKVSIGNLPASSSWCFIIAEEKGYFRDENIEADVVPYDSGAKMIPQLSAGQLDVGAGSASSGLYNAYGRGIDLKIVADAVRGVKGAGQSVLVRAPLLRSGQVKSIADLKGRTVAVTAEAGTEAAVLAYGLSTAGLTYGDVKKVFLPFAQHGIAYQNGAIDASLTAEPAATAAIKLGVADRLMFVGDFYPDAQSAVVLYGQKFVSDRPEVGKRFMKAYVRAVRDYNDAIKDGHIAGKGAEEIIAILTKRFKYPPDVIRTMWAHAINPDGWVNVDGIRRDFQFFKDQNQIKVAVQPEDVLDRRFVDYAVQALGPYQRPGQ